MHGDARGGPGAVRTGAVGERGAQHGLLQEDGPPGGVEPPGVQRPVPAPVQLLDVQAGSGPADEDVEEHVALTRARGESAGGMHGRAVEGAGCVLLGRLLRGRALPRGPRRLRLRGRLPRPDSGGGQQIGHRAGRGVLRGQVQGVVRRGVAAQGGGARGQRGEGRREGVLIEGTAQVQRRGDAGRDDHGHGDAHPLPLVSALAGAASQFKGVEYAWHTHVSLTRR